MVLAKVDLRLGEIGLSGAVEVQVGLLDVALHAETVAVHDAEAVIGLAVAL